MKKLIFVVLIFSVFIASSVVFADELDDVLKSGELRMGTSPDYIPFVFYDDSGTLTGIDVALMEEVSRRMNVQLDVVDIAFDGLIDSLNIGQVDVIGGGFSQTDSRQEQIDFTRVYYTGDAEFIALSSMQIPQSVELSDFHDLKIGTQKGTSFDQWIKTNLVGGGYVDSKNVYTYAGVKDAMRALDNGDIDLVLMDQDVYEDLYRDTGNYQLYYEGFAKENYAFGLKKGSALTSVIDGHLTDMFKDGTAQSIADRFFQMDFDEVQPGIIRPSQLPTPTPSIQPVIIPTQPPASCTNGMVFIADITITDGTQVMPGEQFRKTWRVQNTGSCTWTPDYSLVFVSGDQMSGQNIYVSATVLPGQTIDLSVDLVAPYDEGVYQGNWQMSTPWRTNFGQTIWVKVNDVNSYDPTPEPYDPTPIPTHATGLRVPVEILQFYPDSYSGWEGNCPTVYWSTDGANTVTISVDGEGQISSGSENGSQQICGPLVNEGTHSVDIYAYNNTDGASASFIYTTNHWEEPTPEPTHETGLITPVPTHPTGFIPDNGDDHATGFGFGASN